jgi:hypothetical protein
MRSLLALCAGAFAAVSAGFTADINIKTCDASGCTPAKKRVALDATSNHTSSAGASLVSVGGANLDALTLTYGGADVGGPRVYLIEEDGVDKNFMFALKNAEFTFDVELSAMPCGFNAALYFVGMTPNEGGAEAGTGYCDAQAVGGTFCSEMDVLEANTGAQQFTTHACVDACASHTNVTECKGTGSPATVCDQNGCGLNPFRYGPGTTYNTETNNGGWYGAGKTLDSGSRFTVVTQFRTVGDSAAGQLSNITRFYVQNGRRIELPTLYVLPPSDGSHMGGFAQPQINDGYCTDIYDRWDAEQDKPLAQMGKNMENGMVLAMSAWYAQETYVDGKPAGGSQTGMSWLDGVNQWGKYVKAGPCNTTTTDAAGPYHATFSDIRIGAIGTTVPPSAPTPAPAPTPPTPAPPTPPTPAPPAPGKCCYNGCGSGNCVETGFCGTDKTNCEGNCNGSWCPK